MTLPSREGVSGRRLRCPISETCGGCILAGADLAAERDFKRDVLAAEAGDWPRLRDVFVEPTLGTDDDLRYRNRAKLAVREVAGRVRIGLFRRGSNDIVDIEPCQIHRPAIQDFLSPLRDWLGEHGLAAPRGPIKHVDLREGAGLRIHATFVLGEAQSDALVGRLIDATASLEGVAGIRLNFSPDDSSYVFGEDSRQIAGEKAFEISAGDECPWTVPVGGFFQVNATLIGPLHALMGIHLGERGALDDVYCGVGLHGIRLVGEASGADLLGVEQSTDAAIAARVNATRRLSVNRFRFIAGAAEDVYPSIAVERRAPRVILNPGRAGCQEPVLTALGDGASRRVAYLSCNPHTLCRDLERLVEGGYEVERLIPVDMMPHTDQVEALALLRST